MDDPYNQPDEPIMEFQLTYDGPLYAAQRDINPGQRDNRRDHKHDIRKVFGRQLNRLWETNSFLKSGRQAGEFRITKSIDEDIHPYNREDLARQFCQFGFNFVPLVTRELNLICGLEILFLRPSIPGNLIRAGDIDNRLKVLFDALKIPSAEEKYADRTP